MDPRVKPAGDVGVEHCLHLANHNLSCAGLTRASIVPPTPMVAYYVYILASQPNGTLYIGVTNDLVRRVYEHREGLTGGFTKRHGV